MTYENFKNKLLALSPESKCLRFIADRIKQDDYRGIHISQHNRYTFEKACDILYELKCVAKSGMIKIRTRDISKHPSDMEGTEKYSLFCETLRKKFGKYTQDTIRKNFFVDFARMGLINRYDKNKEKIPLSKRTCCQYVALSDRGMILANKTQTIKNKYVAFSKGLDMMCDNLPLTLFNLSANTDLKITRMEYTYFVSFIGKDIISKQADKEKNITVTESQVIDYISEYRNIRELHADIDSIVKEYANPKNFTGDKKNKRDFSNWINETEQTLKLLSNTVYFEYLEKYNTLKLRVDGRMGIDSVKRITRSAQEKENYFTNHEVEKCETNTLHHIVPLDRWEDFDDFKLLDDWRNMIYIDVEEHKSLHKTLKNGCILSIVGNDFTISNDSECTNTYINGINVFYSLKKINDMISYNKELLK